MANHGKRWRTDQDKVPAAPVSVQEAVQCLLGFQKTKFDQTVELVLNLGIDPRQAEQALRGSVSLPHGVGGSKKVIAFCEGPDIEAAKAAGAVDAGGEDLVKKVQDGWLDFDVAIATPAMMRLVSRLGRVLGPQGKMPSPKSGTVTPDIAQAVGEFSAGKLEYRNDSGGNVQVPIGKMSFDAAKLAENAEFFIEHMRRRKPSTAKGTYFKKVFITATMTPSVPVEVH
ncbi:MAG: 50S ribosomal protein L1 [Planctomycetes bacterium]|nr:50S ribosomal protein L1 [Planctomycetota bacterium]